MLKIKINGNNSINISLSEETCIIDSNRVHLDLITHSNTSYHLIIDHQSIPVDVVKYREEDQSLTLRIGNQLISLQIEDQRDILLEQLGIEASMLKNDNLIKAPMPGLILDIVVKEGSKVNKGDKLLVLEAMKMENIITAPHDGVVKKINVDVKDNVEKHQKLIDLG